MRRLTVLAGAFGAALLMNCGAFAQVAADPNNPNEAVPDAMAPPPYGETINTETPKRSRQQRSRKRKNEIGTGSASRSSDPLATSSISRNRTIANSPRPPFPSIRPAQRRAIAVQRWCSNVFSAKVTSSLI